VRGEFSQASESFKEANPHIFPKGTLGQVLLEPEECEPSKEEAKSERILQGQIVGILRLRSIEPLWHRTDKKSAATVGWPDLTFTVYALADQRLSDGHVSDRLPKAWQVFPCLWEVKLPGKKLSKAQERMRALLTHPPNCWRYRVIHSVDEALAELKELGIEIAP
jgi:hypothetical protein